MENITSEQELKQLLDEGKINEEEYQELFNVIKKKTTDKKNTLQNISEKNANSKLGKIAVVLMLIGLVLPFICFLIIKAIAPPIAKSTIHIIIFFAFELTALLLGIKSWQTENGKAAGIVSGIIILVALIFVL